MKWTLQINGIAMRQTRRPQLEFQKTCNWSVQNEQCVISIDPAKIVFQVCLINEHCTPVFNKKVTRTKKWQFDQSLVCMPLTAATANEIVDKQGEQRNMRALVGATSYPFTFVSNQDKACTPELTNRGGNIGFPLNAILFRQQLFSQSRESIADGIFATHLTWWKLQDLT